MIEFERSERSGMAQQYKAMPGQQPRWPAFAAIDWRIKVRCKTRRRWSLWQWARLYPALPFLTVTSPACMKS